MMTTDDRELRRRPWDNGVTMTRIPSALLMLVATGILLMGSSSNAILNAQAADLGGGSTFRLYCASCHGAAGKGDGPLASSMKVAPADLTQIAKKNGGVFPTDRVSRTIDGRSPSRVHGSDMPVWGDAFASSRLDSASATQRIQRLVAFIQSIQQPTP